jgi:hypothetical protein
MFALNAAAFMNACEPSAFKEPSPHEPRRSVQYTQGQLGECVRRNALALDDRDASRMRPLPSAACAAWVPWHGMRRCVACLPSAAADSHACFTHPSLNGEIFRAVTY